MNILHYIISWFLTADFLSSKPVPCRNASIGMDGICTSNSSCFSDEIIGFCSEHAFSDVCCRIPRFGNMVAGNIGFVSREKSQMTKKSASLISRNILSNNQSFEMDEKHGKRNFVSSNSSSGLRKPPVLNYSIDDKTAISDLTKVQRNSKLLSKSHDQKSFALNLFQRPRIRSGKYSSLLHNQNIPSHTLSQRKLLISNSSGDQKGPEIAQSSPDHRKSVFLDFSLSPRDLVTENSSINQRPVFSDSLYDHKQTAAEHSYHDQKTAVTQIPFQDRTLLIAAFPSHDLKSLLNRDSSCNGRQQDPSWDERSPPIHDPLQHQRKSAVPEALHDLRKPVVQAQDHDLRKSVVQSLDHDLRNIAMKNQDLRKPAVQAQDHDLRSPVKSEVSHDLRRPVFPEGSHDLRWPVLEEDSHDMRLPVGNFYGHQDTASGELSSVDPSITETSTSLSEKETSNMWSPLEFRNIKIFPEFMFSTSDFNGKNAYPDISKVCGRSKSQVTARLVGGLRSHHLQWPWMISLRISHWKKKQFFHRCGSALLNHFWVITAAHCVQGKLLSNMQLRLGEYRVDDSDNPSVYLERSVRKMVVHPSFNPDTYENDLALLLFDEPIPFDERVIPICLPMQWDDEDLAGKTAVVTGWGRLSEGGGMPEVLHEVHLPILTNKDCQEMYAEAGFPEKIHEVFICAGFPDGGFDTCDGDSGGPLMVMGNEGEWNLVGIVSWGKACAAPKQPGVYTRITKFIDWIIEIITF